VDVWEGSLRPETVRGEYGRCVCHNDEERKKTLFVIPSLHVHHVLFKNRAFISSQHFNIPPNNNNNNNNQLRKKEYTPMPD